jgi:tRNA (guanine-N7-)-methyltransferase
MGKNKLRRFEENEQFTNVFQPSYKEVQTNGFSLQGAWDTFFKNLHPITLELGCGKGEYTVGQAQQFPERNFIGVDVKGARFWKGAKFAIENKLPNVAFVRTRIDQITHLFSQADNISEIWITFPDPQPRESKEKKRLTSPPFLDRYRNISQPSTTINLKTDSIELFDYTLSVIHDQQLKIHEQSRDVYQDYPSHPILGIQTFYESMWLQQGKKIHYLKFNLFG